MADPDHHPSAGERCKIPSGGVVLECQEAYGMSSGEGETLREEGGGSIDRETMSMD